MKAKTRLTSEYADFRTGMSFAEIYQILKIECECGKRRHVTRHTVLGKWHEIKQSMYREMRESYGLE